MSAPLATTRRAALAGLAGAVCSGAALAATIPCADAPSSEVADLDRELFAAIAAFDAARYALDNILSPMADEDIDRLDIAFLATIEPIERITARTPAGIRAKARVAHIALFDEAFCMLHTDWRDQGTAVERLAITALRDAAGLIGSEAA